MKATCARSVVQSLSINQLIKRIKNACGQRPLCLGYIPSFEAIKSFIVKLLWSWVMLKTDTPCHTSCDDLNKNYIPA